MSTLAAHTASPAAAPASAPAPHYPPAPPLQVSHWFNTAQPPTLERLRGRVVALHAFQMLCPGCVSHGLPQAARLHELFPRQQLAVIGLHTVFEHHEVMGPPAALQAFIHEYRLGFPIGIDQPSGHEVPRTMQSLQLRGTPSLLLLDKQGRVRLHHFGHMDDLRLGALIGELIAEPDAPKDPTHGAAHARAGTGPAAVPGHGATGPAPACDDTGCVLPPSTQP